MAQPTLIARSVLMPQVIQLRRALVRTGANVVTRALDAVGPDVSDELKRRHAIVFAPHPDDEILGCAGTILLKRANGMRVTVVSVTDGSAFAGGSTRDENRQVRHDELRLACHRLGLDDSNLICLEFPDGRLAEHHAELEQAVAKILAQRVDSSAPFDLLCSAPWDPHPDHGALGRALRGAAKPVGTYLLEYPIHQKFTLRSWLPTLANFSKVGLPVHVCVADQLGAKAHALRAHASQLRPEAGGNNPEGLGIDLVKRFLSTSETYFRAPDPGSDRRLARG